MIRQAIDTLLSTANPTTLSIVFGVLYQRTPDRVHAQREVVDTVQMLQDAGWSRPYIGRYLQGLGTVGMHGYYRQYVEQDRLQDKYIVFNRVGDIVDGAFVLFPETDDAARAALSAYADNIEHTYPALAEDIRKWLNDIYTRSPVDTRIPPEETGVLDKLRLSDIDEP